MIIDINCDLGEGFGNYPMPNDTILFDYISSANIACGFHAGDPAVMERSVRLAHEKGVAIGAHPGLADLQGFGRREMRISAKEAYQITIYQIGALYGFVKAAGAKLSHVKPHGALYNMAANDKQLAEALAQAVYDFDPHLTFYALSGSEMITAASRLGLKTASEVFADRTYQNDGTLTPRSHKNALIHNQEQSINQVLRMINQQEVESAEGKVVKLKADTICIHGDGPKAVEFAKLIHERLVNTGIEIKPTT
ncbi:LamB/YcsF family protein [Desertivirga brevis]|uniref:LamB/YcsF family protein n=1 Tax=Desertivirga brevis TaxID=2810310 RepID=UPI001A9606FB|nr:5-oxoprolinase subunit PxpA [Pedobacter sp. SYSU D00873]